MKRLFSILLCLAAFVAVAGYAFAGVAPTGHEFALNDPSFIVPGAALGLLVNKESLTAVFINLKTTFNKAFEGAPSDWEQTAMRVPSGSSQNNYDWLDRFPKMRKWVGDKVLKSLQAFTYTVKNDDWEATVSVRRNDIEDDQLGIYAPMAEDAGYSAKTLPDEIVADLKNNAFENKCFDGQFFYDTDHPVEDGEGDVASVSNRGTKKLSADTPAAALASLGEARHAIANFTDNQGRKLGLKAEVLEVPVALEEVGHTLCYADKLNDNSPNPYKGTLKLLVNSRLTSDTAWFVHVTSRPIKPYLYQERKAPVFVQQINMEADDVFMRGEYKFGAEARAAGGYTLWQLSYGSDGTA